MLIFGSVYVCFTLNGVATLGHHTVVHLLHMLSTALYRIAARFCLANAVANSVNWPNYRLSIRYHDPLRMMSMNLT